MQPKLLKHVVPLEGSFKVWKNAHPYRHNPWHYHPEIEINLVENGTGTLFVGDHIEQYLEMDLFILGSNLPHEWRSEQNLVQQPDEFSSSLAIHFLGDFLGSPFYRIPETSELVNFIDRTKLGIKIKDVHTIEKVQTLIYDMLCQQGLAKLLTLLDVLQEIAKCKEFYYLCSEGFTQSFHGREHEKINVIYKYVIKNFKNKISLAEVADLVFMTPTAFCRFFKRCTHKSFVHYLNEIRTGYAKKLLLEDDFNIAQVAYESGFNNLSNFNKQFKQIHGLAPSEYKSKFLKT